MNPYKRPEGFPKNSMPFRQ